MFSLRILLFAFGLFVEHGLCSDQFACSLTAPGKTLIWESLSHGLNQIVASHPVTKDNPAVNGYDVLSLANGAASLIIDSKLPPAVYKCYSLDIDKKILNPVYKSIRLTDKSYIPLSTAQNSVDNTACCVDAGLSPACANSVCRFPQPASLNCAELDAESLAAIGKCNSIAASSFPQQSHFAGCCSTWGMSDNDCLELCNSLGTASVIKPKKCLASVGILSKCAYTARMKVAHLMTREVLLSPDSTGLKALATVAAEKNSAIILNSYRRRDQTLASRQTFSSTQNILINNFMTSLASSSFRVQLVNPTGSSEEVPLVMTVTEATKYSLGLNALYPRLASNQPVLCQFATGSKVTVMSLTTGNCIYSKDPSIGPCSMDATQFEVYLMAANKVGRTGQSWFVTTTAVGNEVFMCHGSGSEANTFVTTGVDQSPISNYFSGSINRQGCCVAGGMSSACAAFACQYPSRGSLAACSERDLMLTSLVGQCASRSQPVFATTCCARLASAPLGSCLLFCNNFGQQLFPQWQPANSAVCFRQMIQVIHACVYLMAENSPSVTAFLLKNVTKSDYTTSLYTGQYQWTGTKVSGKYALTTMSFITDQSLGQFPANFFSNEGYAGIIYVSKPHRNFTMQFSTVMGSSKAWGVSSTPGIDQPVKNAQQATTPGPSDQKQHNYTVTLKSVVFGAGDFTVALNDSNSSEFLSLERNLCDPVLTQTKITKCKLLKAQKGSVIATVFYEQWIDQELTTAIAIVNNFVSQLVSVTSTVYLNLNPEFLEVIQVTASSDPGNSTLQIILIIAVTLLSLALLSLIIWHGVFCAINGKLEFFPDPRKGCQCCGISSNETVQEEDYDDNYEEEEEDHHEVEDDDDGLPAYEL